ncbi:zinc dependent phospholipase C family protein [Desulfovibrio inopinatus]|uniref:zinc dependent phospholipase C family protein n=1 Tax=Desulfovibrio inopinatus TaxID=102109 RepID=UPI0004041AF7|nr:zinc dependent phospholipase C family protein [Desulfovibrio inopinatus]
MGFLLIVPLVLGVFVFCGATDAFAWGPGAHMATGHFILENLRFLPVSMGAILEAHRQAFLYGCLSTDFFVGSGSRTRPPASHSWETGFRLLKTADTPELAAYAYGYLAHLAADTVSHNYFVPNILATMPSRGKLSHVYAEMLADARIDWCGREAAGLFAHQGDADATLRVVMSKSRRSFYTKKYLFRLGLLVGDTGPWTMPLRYVRGKLPSPVPETFLDTMLDTTKAVVFDLLTNPDSAVALDFDPTGKLHLNEAKKLQKRAQHTDAFPLSSRMRGLIRIWH